MTDKILIIDFGSQVTQLIARRLRELHIYCEIHPFNAVDGNFLTSYAPAGIILSGGPDSVNAASAPLADAAVFGHGVPILGICYGEQILCGQLGGVVESGGTREFGKAALQITGSSPLFSDIKNDCQVWMSHGDKVQSLPAGFEVIGKSDNAPFAAIQDSDRQFYGVQFHPEVTHTLIGTDILRNFACGICGLNGDWTMAGYLQSAIGDIKKQVGKSHVVCGLSGGVDSAVTAALIHRAIGDQLTCIFVDTGLLRHQEGQQITELFRSHYNIPLLAVDAGDRFLQALKGVTDPEEKRKIIGKLFIDVFDETSAELPASVEFLAQGTLYPDVIESVSAIGGPSVTIKSHHNVGGLPERMNLQLLEPLRFLFKDEVRALGAELGLPDSMISRHPFPGPGLAVRIPGEVTPAACDILRKADRIYIEELHSANLYHNIWQAFAVLLPVRTVGVMGDARTYEHVCGLRAVTSTDGMTAEAFEFPAHFLNRVATRIVNEVEGINRVVYDCTSKPPATIEWE